MFVFSPHIEEVKQIIESMKGNVSAVAKHYKVSRQTFYNYLHKTPELVQCIEDSRESMLDNAESVLYSKVLAGHTAELLFFLKTRGKNRGYVERQEYSGPDGQPFKVYLNFSPDEI